MLKLRLARGGRKGQPYYRIVVAEADFPRDGRFLEKIGYLNPMTQPESFEVVEARALHWLSVGAQPTDAVRRLLERQGTFARLQRLHKGEELGKLVAEYEGKPWPPVVDEPVAPVRVAKKSAPVAEVVVEPVVEVVAEPVVEVVAEPAVEVVAEPAVEVVAEPAVEVVAEPVVEVVSEPVVDEITDAGAAMELLLKIEGIGPKIAEILVGAGIGSYETLSVTSVDRLKEVLASAGGRYRMAVPDSWPQQAVLAAAGKWDELKLLQDRLTHGRVA